MVTTSLGRVSILGRQDINSKSGEEQKKVITSVKVLISTQNRVQSKKKSQNDNVLMLGRVTINTRTRPSNALILGRVLDSAHPYFHIPEANQS